MMLPENAWNCHTVLAKISVWTTLTVSDPVKCAQHIVHAVGTADGKLLLGWSQRTCGVTVNFYTRHTILSVRLSQPGTKSIPDGIETPGFL